MRVTREQIRRVADDAVTEGVNLRWVDHARKMLYEASATLAETEQERDEARMAVVILDAWVSSMPDAGFNDQSPRWRWWHERPKLLKVKEWRRLAE